MIARLAILSTVLIAVACTPSNPDIAIGKCAGTDEASVRALLESIVEQPGAPPSISIAVARDGRVAAAAAVGLADVDGGVAATTETTYRVYSISKAITAVAVMQLQSAGRLDLDDDIRTFVPAFPEKPWPITLRHLLTHTSGIRHYKENAGEISSRVEYASLADSLDVFKDDPLEFEPGTDTRYTTFGFNLLTGAVESVSGTTFGDYLATRVFEPAGMTATHLAIHGRPDPSIATAYAPGNREMSKLPNVSGRYGSSGVVSTPTDLMRLVLALEDGRLMDAAALRRMLTVADPELSERQALGVSVTRDDAGRRLVYSTGGGVGFTGLLFHYPDAGVTGALLVNQAEFDERVELLDALLRPWLDEQE